MYRNIPVLFLLVAVVFVSCKGNEYNPFDAEIHYVTPEMTDTIYGTPVCTLSSDEKPLEYVLEAVCDSLLVLTTYNSHDHIFTIVNLNTGKMTEMTSVGRGPDEMISAVSCRLVKGIGDSLFLHAYDLSSQCNFVEINLTEALISGNVAFRPLGKVIPTTLHAFEMDDSTNLYYRLDDNFQKMQRMFKDGSRIISSHTLFPDIAANEFSIMSFSCHVKEGTDKVAICMSSFPELNFLDMNTGDRSSVVFSPKLDFRTEFDRHLSTRKYPDMANGICYSDEDNICVFRYSLYHENPSTYIAPSVLVFDWDGNFKHELLLYEPCGMRVVDSENKLLYAVTEDDVLYRYDLSKYFEKF